MRVSHLARFLIPALLAGLTASCFAASSGSDSFGFSSDEWGSGSYLGVDTRDITPDRLSALHLKEEKGVEVTMVDQDAPAGKAGLKEHDVIMSVNGAEVESVEQLRRLIRETPPGRIVTMGVSRNGQPMTFKVQLADRKNSFAYSPMPKDFHFEMPAMPTMPDMDLPVSVVVVHSSMRSGLMVENLSPQLGEYFGTRNGQGILVRSVEKGSMAEKAGFRAGDVIVKVNGEPVHDSGDFTHALRSRKENTVTVGILREKKEQTITLTLPEHKQSNARGGWDIHEMSSEMGDDLSDLQAEMANLGPEIEQAVNSAHIREEAQRAAREVARHSAEFKHQMREMRRQMDEFRKELPEHSADI